MDAVVDATPEETLATYPERRAHGDFEAPRDTNGEQPALWVLITTAATIVLQNGS